MSDVRLETVKKLSLHPGDILHVQVGGDMGGGLPPWIPTFEAIQAIQELWENVLPQGVRAVYTHYLVDEQIIQSHINASRWPPKVTPTH